MGFWWFGRFTGFGGFRVFEVLVVLGFGSFGGPRASKQQEGLHFPGPGLLNSMKGCTFLPQGLKAAGVTTAGGLTLCSRRASIKSGGIGGLEF